MRRLILPAALLACLVLAGCLESKETFVLKKDGSGTIESAYTVDITKGRELFQAAAMYLGVDAKEYADLPDEKLPNFESPAWYRAAAAKVDGYEVTAAKQELVGEAGKPGRKRVTTVNATFTSLNAAAKAGAFALSSVSLSKVDKSDKAPRGGWKLVLRNALTGLDPSVTGGLDPAQTLPFFESQLKDDLRITRTVRVPGKILSTNGTTGEDGHTVSWTFTYDKIIAGKDLSMSVVFEATDDMKLQTFSSTPDVMALARRLKGKPPKAAGAKSADGKSDGAEPTQPKSDK